MRVCQRQRRHLWETLKRVIVSPVVYPRFLEIAELARSLCYSWATCSTISRNTNETLDVPGTYIQRLRIWSLGNIPFYKYVYRLISSKMLIHFKVQSRTLSHKPGGATQIKIHFRRPYSNRVRQPICAVQSSKCQVQNANLCSQIKSTKFMVFCCKY